MGFKFECKEETCEVVKEKNLKNLEDFFENGRQSQLSEEKTKQITVPADIAHFITDHPQEAYEELRRAMHLRNKSQILF